MLENVLIPETAHSESKREDLKPLHHPHHKHEFLPPKPAFTLQEEFMKTVQRVNDTLARIIRQNEYMKESVDEFTAKLSADNVAFKDLVTSTYNQFSSTVTAEVNSFESEMINTYDAFSKSVTSDWENFKVKYTEFETLINGKIDDFESRVNTLFEEYKTLINDGFATFKNEVTQLINQAIEQQTTNFDGFTKIIERKHEQHENEVDGKINDFKGEMNDVYNTFRESIESRLTQYNSAYAESFSDYTTQMNNNLANMERDFNDNYATFVEHTNNAIESFQNEWASIVNAKIMEQNATINDAKLYMETNLKATLTSIVDELIEKGEVETISISTYDKIKTKIPEIVNVKEWLGASKLALIESGEKDWSDYLGNAYYSASLKNKILYFPNGEYNFGKGRICITTGQSIIGESKTGVKFIKKSSRTDVTNPSLNDNVILVTKPSEDTNTMQYVTIKNISIEGALSADYDFSDNELPLNYGIKFHQLIGHAIIDNVSIAKAINGIVFEHGGFLNELSNIDIAEVENGIVFNKSGTSTNLRNTYVMKSSVCAYKFTGLSYSHWQNVCADWCLNKVYDFEGCDITINGMGCECTESLYPVTANNTKLNVSNAVVFTNPDYEEYTVITANGSNICVDGFKLDTYDGNTHECKGMMYNLATDSKLTLKDVKSMTNFAKKPTSTDPDSVFTYTDRINDFTVNNHKTVIGSTIHPSQDDLPFTDKPYYDGSIWFNNVETPRQGRYYHNSQYALSRKMGDIFVNNAGKSTGVAMWQQVSHGEDFELPLTPVTASLTDGILTVVCNSADNNKDNQKIEELYGNYFNLMWNYTENNATNEKLLLRFKFGGYNSIFNLETHTRDTNTFTFKFTLVEGEMSVENGVLFLPDSEVIILEDISDLKLYWKGATNIGETQFRPIQHLLALTKYDIALLMEKANIPDGLQVFDTTLKKPLWYYKYKFYDASGNVVYDGNNLVPLYYSQMIEE